MSDYDFCSSHVTGDVIFERIKVKRHPIHECHVLSPFTVGRSEGACASLQYYLRNATLSQCTDCLLRTNGFDERIELSATHSHKTSHLLNHVR